MVTQINTCLFYFVVVKLCEQLAAAHKLLTSKLHLFTYKDFNTGLNKHGESLLSIFNQLYSNYN